MLIIYQYYQDKEVLKVEVPHVNEPVIRTYKKRDGEIVYRKWDNFNAWENGMARVTDFRLVLE